MVGDAVDVVGTVVVVGALFDEDSPPFRCVRLLGLSVVVVAALAGLVEVAPVGMCRVVRGRVVVVGTEVSRGGASFVVVVRGDVRLSDFFRSVLVVVVEFFARPVVASPVADVPARCASLRCSCRLPERCRLSREYGLAAACRFVEVPEAMDVEVPGAKASDVPGAVDVGLVVGTAVVGGPPGPVARRWLAGAPRLGPCCVGRAVVVDPKTRLELVGALGAGVAGLGTLVPSDTARVPSAVLMDATSLVPAIRWVNRSSKKVSANRSNCSR
ncbi:MAG: hypothetical protein ABSA91_17255 [Acidimicrobiales bacterium]